MAVGLQRTYNCAWLGVSVERQFWYTDASFFKQDYREGQAESYGDLSIRGNHVDCRGLFVVLWFWVLINPSEEW